MEITIFFFIFFIFLLLFSGVCVFFLLGWWWTNGRKRKSPFSEEPLILGDNISYSSVEKVEKHILDMEKFGTRYFSLTRAAVCRKSGRIFPNVVNSFGMVTKKSLSLLDYYQGNFIDWHKLSLQEKEKVVRCHSSLKGFDLATKENSLFYADPHTSSVLGWGAVPGTRLKIPVLRKVQIKES